MSAFIILTAIVLIALLLPVAKRSVRFDEKDETIKVYRQEVAYIEAQHRKEWIDAATKTQLLAELDRKSALAMLAIEEKTFAYRSLTVPALVVVLVLSVCVSLYAHFYEKQRLSAWHSSHKTLQGEALSGLFDEKIVREFVATHDENTASTYCFVMQQRLNADYPRNPTALANVAQCHLSQRHLALAQTAIARALRQNAEHVPSFYVLGELEFLQRQQLSDLTRERLSAAAEVQPTADLLYLLMLDRYTTGDFQQAKHYANKLQPFAENYPTLRQALNAIAPQIDAQLYMREEQP